MRSNYAEFGVSGYYARVSESYRNPHFSGVVDGVQRMLDLWHVTESLWRAPTGLTVLDLACGSGEATVAVEQWLASRKQPPAARAAREGNRPTLPEPFCVSIDAADPYTSSAYRQRTGRDAQTFSFQDVADGCLQAADVCKVYDVCVCSFAAHLMNESLLFVACTQLSLSCQYFMILTPHKKPVMKSTMGWELLAEQVVEQRVHARLYRSLNL